MSEETYQFIALDLPALIAASFAAVACALVGNFLLLRRASLVGDAIAHSVLPGIVLAFVISGSRATFTVLAGAAIAGISAALLAELIRRLGKLEAGAAMGVVFSIFFASGVLLIEQAASRGVDLDAECLLHGQLETVFWSPPATWPAFHRFLLSGEVFQTLPRQVLSSGFVALVSLVFVGFFFKELRITSFDPLLSTSLGFSAKRMHYLLMALVAAAVVASFEVVGSILVIAMLICPAAIARFYTDRLQTQVVLSVLFALLATITGYLAGALLPLWLGGEHSLNAAGMMTVSLGIILLLSIFFAPQYGLIARALAKRQLQSTIEIEDLLGHLFRLGESVVESSAVGGRTIDAAQSFVSVPLTNLAKAIPSAQLTRSTAAATARNLVKLVGEEIHLTSAGYERALKVVRGHRLWEQYLHERAGFRVDHVHEPATVLEHFASGDLAERLDARVAHPTTDPHGRPIPATIGDSDVTVRKNSTKSER